MKATKLKEESKKEVKYKTVKEIQKILIGEGVIETYDAKVRAYTLNRKLSDAEFVKYVKGICPYTYTVDPRGKKLSKYYGKELWAYQANTPLVKAPVIHAFNGRNYVLKSAKLSGAKSTNNASKELQYAYLEIINEE